MKLIFCLLLIFFSPYAFAQNNTILVSTTGIGDIKIGMKKADLEKLTGQKLALKHLASKKETAAYQDTFRINHKGIEIEVMLQKGYAESNLNDIVVYQVKSNSLLAKTKSGIGIGDDKLKIVSTYNDYTLHLFPEYENDDQTKSKTKSTVWLYVDNSEQVIIFYLENNKVTGFSVMVSEGC